MPASCMAIVGDSSTFLFGLKGKGKKSNLTILPQNLENIYVVPTLENGEFTLKDLIFFDSAKFGIQPADVKVVLKNKEVPPLPEKLPDYRLHLVPLNEAQQGLRRGYLGCRAS